MADMEAPNKRPRLSPPTVFSNGDDFVPLGVHHDDASNFLPSHSNDGRRSHTVHNATRAQAFPNAPQALRAMSKSREQQKGQSHSSWFSRRHAQDRPRFKHVLEGHDPWVLVITKYGRRFVHNTKTQESLWRVPPDVLPGVLAFEQAEVKPREKEENARWAEEQLKTIRQDGESGKVNGEIERTRRRRSESLQKEDEEAMMAELAAEAEKMEAGDAKEALKEVESLEHAAQSVPAPAYDSDSSYEEVEVTDSEFEEDDADKAGLTTATTETMNLNQEHIADNGPVEFGEDDIAYQLAAMGESYGLDPGEYGADIDEDEGEEDGDEVWEDGQGPQDDDEGLPLSDDDAINLFREMLDEHQISPFTPWEKLIADPSSSDQDSIVLDDRYTVLPSTRVRKAAWEAWVKDTAARLREERQQEQSAQSVKFDAVQQQKIAYLEFLATYATPTKLYWPEFKRKHKRESVMSTNPRHALPEREREKIFREHVSRQKLPRHRLEEDLRTLVRGSGEDGNAPKVRANLVSISLPKIERDRVLNDLRNK